MAVSGRLVTNDELGTLMDTSDAWISQRTGIRTRYWVEAPTTTSDLALAAARRSLDAWGGEAQSIDAIVAATLSPDYDFPGIGVLLQHKLGLPPVPAFDVRAQCSGFLYGLQMALAFVRAGVYRRVLLVGAEVHSTGLDISTRGRDVAVLFGDGAGSCIVERRDDAPSGSSFEVLGIELHGDGAYAQELWCEHPGSAHFPTRLTPDMVAKGATFPRMNGRKVFEHAVRGMTEVSRSLLRSLSIDISQIGLFVPHQANLRINQMVAEQLGLSSSQVFNTIERYGNTTAATIPIGMSEAGAQGRVTPEMLVLNAVFGSGFTWGAALLRAH